MQHQILRECFHLLFLLLCLSAVAQVKGGVAGLYDGAEVVLGPDSGLLEPGPEQQFINQKMRPGSGVLSVQVLPDGPTRVLQVGNKEPGQTFSKLLHLVAFAPPHLRNKKLI